MKKLLFCISAVVFAILLFGCGRPAVEFSDITPSNPDLIRVSYRIVNNLENNLKTPISPDDAIIVASFVNINNLKISSTFGRLMAEQIGSRLAQKGYKVIEMKLRHSSVFIEKGQGEFLLSRDIMDIGQTHNASAVVVGTYGCTDNKIYISTRIINPENSVILASDDSEIIANEDQQASLMKQ